MNDLTLTGNLLEACLWFTIAFTLLVAAWQATAAFRKLAMTECLAFLAFGVSDLIESTTGAWWHPWWLLLLKATCIATFIYGLWKYRRLKHNSQ